MISGARPPFSQNRVALITFIDSNGRLVFPGDDVDVMGNYDLAAYGKVVAGIAHLQS